MDALPPHIADAAVVDNDLVVASVLSGNRNFGSQSTFSGEDELLDVAHACGLLCIGGKS